MLAVGDEGPQEGDRMLRGHSGPVTWSSAPSTVARPHRKMKVKCNDGCQCLASRAWYVCEHESQADSPSAAQARV